MFLTDFRRPQLKVYWHFVSSYEMRYIVDVTLFQGFQDARVSLKIQFRLPENVKGLPKHFATCK